MQSPVVVKVGGSLLIEPRLREYAARCLESSSAPSLFVVGGGALADSIRQLDGVHHLGESFSHWRCVDILDTTAAVFAELTGAPLVRSLDEELTGPAVLAPAPFLYEVEPTRSDPLPHCWAVTTDSIAARVAEWLDAELILWKSATQPSADWGHCAECGYVDEHFPRIAPRLRRVSVVDVVAVLNGSP